jgi:glycerol-3-phosphate dehydrogenase (NAD(P)+)
MKDSVCVLGDGGWGTALALLIQRKGLRVSLWGAFPDYIEEVARTRVNRKFLPQAPIPEEIRLTSDLGEALDRASTVIFAVPSQYLRQVCRRAAPLIRPDCLAVSAAKGLEIDTRKRMSEVLREELKTDTIAVISGPSHAEEVARNLPAAVVAASARPAAARRAQELLMDERFRIYTLDDVVGVEMGGAIKNVIAIAAGISDGFRLGDNTKAAILTRGMVEIARLGTALGGKIETFWGLSGIGDLIATSCSPYGRNWRLGRLIGEGLALDKALSSTEMVCEGVRSSAAVRDLSARAGVEMPIAGDVYRVLYEGKPPLRAVKDLMTREAKTEAFR